MPFLLASMATIVSRMKAWTPPSHGTFRKPTSLSRCRPQTHPRLCLSTRPSQSSSSTGCRKASACSSFTSALLKSPRQWYVSAITTYLFHIKPLARRVSNSPQRWGLLLALGLHVAHGRRACTEPVVRHECAGDSDTVRLADDTRCKWCRDTTCKFAYALSLLV